MTTTRIHLDATPAGAVLSRSACRMMQVRVTADRSIVTCRLCVRHVEEEERRALELARGYEPNLTKLYAGDSAEFLRATEKPLPTSGLTAAQRKAWQYVFGAVAELIAGQRGDGIRPARTTRWLSVRHALAELVHYRVHGASVASLTDPDRIAKQAGLLGTTYSPPGPDRAMTLVEDLAPVQRAWALAYQGPWPSNEVQRLTEEEARQVCLRLVVGQEPQVQVAEDLRVDGKTVGRAARQGYHRVWTYLAERDLIPRHEGRARVEVTANKSTDSDLFGWKEIAEFLGVHEATARDWADEEEMPVRRFGRGVEARRDELREWRASRTTQRRLG